MIFRRKLLLLLASTAFLAAATPVPAQDSFPGKPIRIIVPYAPGGANDLLARVLAKRLGEIFAMGVIVDNRPGGATTVATMAVAKSVPDGHTLYLADRPFVTNPFVYPNTPYDPVKDFEPVAQLGSAPVVLVLSNKAAFKTVPELIAFARAQPGRVAMGSSGAGTTTHIAGELFQIRTGVKFNHIPYKGTGPAINDALGGQIDCIFSPVGSVANFVTSGRLRAVAISSATRSPKLPDVPTFSELGINDYSVSNWYGLLAPAGTPAAVISQLSKAVLSSMQAQEVRTWYETSMVLPGSGSPGDLAAHIKAEMATWAPLIKTLGIKPD